MRVAVVGAGLGGLCVAHGLRRAGADVEVLEAGAGTGDFTSGRGTGSTSTRPGTVRCGPAWATSSSASDAAR
jgi:cation diffusion facilitator CzcD-associated flavoprotein CzcO